MGYNIYMKSDVIIIGAGPAGLTAGIFTCRAGLDTICIEKLAVGGQASLTYEIANYPGFDSISGFDLTDRMLITVLAMKTCAPLTCRHPMSLRKLKKVTVWRENLYYWLTKKLQTQMRVGSRLVRMFITHLKKSVCKIPCKH